MIPAVLLFVLGILIFGTVVFCVGWVLRGSRDRLRGAECAAERKRQAEADEKVNAEWAAGETDGA